MCLITLQGTCHKSCYKFGAATSKWSRLWSFCNSICHVSSVWRKPDIMFIQCAINETTFSKLPWKRNDVPVPKTGQHKESFKVLKKSTVTQYLLFMSFSMPIWKRKSNSWVHEMLWMVPSEVRKNTPQSVCEQSSQFLL